MPALRLPHALSVLILAVTSLSIAAQTLPPRLDVPYVPTPEAVVLRMLQIAEVGPEDYVIDLGSGDGRIPIAAVRDFRAREALGIDLNPQRIAEAEQNAEMAGLTDRVRFVEGDLFEQDISSASVLTMYLLPRVNLRLRPVILERMAPGTRVVSHAFTMDDWEADHSEMVQGSYIYLWIVPARVEGQWEVQNGQGERFTVQLRQRFQMIDGSVQDGPYSAPLAGRLNGAQLTLDMGGERYVGRVDGDRIEGLGGEGAVGGWSARRL